MKHIRMNEQLFNQIVASIHLNAHQKAVLEQILTWLEEKKNNTERRALFMDKYWPMIHWGVNNWITLPFSLLSTKNQKALLKLNLPRYR